MKKFVLLLATVALIAGNSYAQYKPTAGTFSTEVQFNPFDQKGHTFKLDGLKLRYFITDNDALRLKIGFATAKNNGTVNSEDQNSEDSPTLKWNIKNKYCFNSGDVTLNAGYERHLNLSKRISVYFGASIGFERHFVSGTMDGTVEQLEKRNGVWKRQNSSYKTEYTNGNYDPDHITDIDDFDRAYWAVNASVFTGIDFYVYKGLYIGAELGLNVSSLKYSQVKYKSTTTSYDKVTTTKENKTHDNQRLTSVGIDVQPALRLGWSF